MKYDPNWLQKEKSKRYAKQERHMTHMANPDGSKSAICGQGFPVGIRTIMFPSVTNLPGCRMCREKFLKGLNVPMDQNGYPLSTFKI